MAIRRIVFTKKVEAFWILISILLLAVFSAGCETRSVSGQNQKTSDTIERVSKLREESKDRNREAEAERVGIPQTPKNLLVGPPYLEGIPEDSRPESLTQSKIGPIPLVPRGPFAQPSGPPYLNNLPKEMRPPSPDA